MSEAPNFQISNPEGTRELILIVDDDELVTMLVERVLTSEGYRVLTASNGLDALEIYKAFQSEVQFVILDFKMPAMNGFTLFTELRAINPNLPAALTSGFVEDDQLALMMSKGLRGFIPKPLTQQKLLLLLRSMLDKVKAEAKGARASKMQ
jgi:CheY-like chemotaxis protein